MYYSHYCLFLVVQKIAIVLQNKRKFLNPLVFCKFDVKTSYSDKYSSSGAKNGLIAYLNEANWAEVGEYGEDYSVWINNLKRSQVNKQVTVSFQFTMNTPANFSNGEVLYSKDISITYDITNDVEPSNGILDNAKLRAWLKQAKNYLNVYYPFSGTLLDKLGVFDKILDFLSGLMKNGESNTQKAEGALIGNICTNYLKMWLNEIE